MAEPRSTQNDHTKNVAPDYRFTIGGPDARVGNKTPEAKYNPKTDKMELTSYGKMSNDKVRETSREEYRPNAKK